MSTSTNTPTISPNVMTPNPESFGAFGRTRLVIRPQLQSQPVSTYRRNSIRGTSSPVDPFLHQYLKQDLGSLGAGSSGAGSPGAGSPGLVSGSPDIYSKYRNGAAPTTKYHDQKIYVHKSKSKKFRHKLRPAKASPKQSGSQVGDSAKATPVLSRHVSYVKTTNPHPLGPDPSVSDPSTSDPSAPEPPTPENTVTYLPSNFQYCSIDDLLLLVSRMLTNLIGINDDVVSLRPVTTKDDRLTRYHSRAPPNISPLSYLSRLTKFNHFSCPTLLTTIYYIDLLSYNYQPYFTLNSWTVHRFLLVATMTSQKSLEDFFYTNEHYAKVGGVSLNELNCLEIDFLTRINWKCVPAMQMESGNYSIKDSKHVLDLYYRQLVQLMGKPTKPIDTVYVLEEDDDDTSDEEILHNDRNDNDLDASKYNPQGFSVDGSSSPHLKRTYAKYNV